MAWCEAEGVAYLFGLAPNARLKAVLAPEAWEGSAVVPNHRQGGSAVQGFRLPDRDLLEADRGGLWARPSTCPTVPIRVSW